MQATLAEMVLTQILRGVEHVLIMVVKRININEKNLLISLTILSLTGCTTGEKIHNVQTGMTKTQVFNLLGTSNGDSVDGNKEQIHYSNRLTSGWGWDKGDYYVTFVDGKVVQYGSGEIRSAGAPVKGIVVF